MVAGRLQEKNGFYYIVLSYTDSAGKRRQPWIATGLTVKGNKKRAEKMLAETRKSFTIPKGQVSELSPDMAFSDYMRYWLKMMRTAVTETTYSSYCFNVEKHIIPYFEPLGVTLAGLQPRQIQSFYLHEAETLKNTSILRFHANLHKALKYAVRIDLIASNPVDKVDRPKPQAFMASYYSAEEMEKLFEAAQGHKLELIIQLAAFYGLRRAEVMGLRWEAIDFEAKTLTIRHIVTSTRIDGKKILVEADRAKTKSSLRTLPLVDPIAERLKAVKEQQEYNQKICGNCYNQEYLGYVFVDAMGNLIQPDSVTTGFPQLLKENGLRKIRFHDLRHPYVKHTTKIFSLRLMDFQAQAYPDARRKTRGACQLHRGGQSRSPVRPLCNRKRFSCLPPQAKMSWILYAISMRLSGYTSTRSISSSASSVVSASASKIALDASFRLSCRACSSCFCFACANTAA